MSSLIIKFYACSIFNQIIFYMIRDEQKWILIVDKTKQQNINICINKNFSAVFLSIIFFCLYAFTSL